MKKNLEGEYITKFSKFLRSMNIKPIEVYTTHLDMPDGLIIRATFDTVDIAVHTRYSELVHQWAAENKFVVVCEDYVIDGWKNF